MKYHDSKFDQTCPIHGRKWVIPTKPNLTCVPAHSLVDEISFQLWIIQVMMKGIKGVCSCTFQCGKIGSHQKKSNWEVELNEMKSFLKGRSKFQGLFFSGNISITKVWKYSLKFRLLYKCSFKNYLTTLWWIMIASFACWCRWCLANIYFSCNKPSGS